MSPGAKELRQNLHRTQAEEVTVSFDQVTEWIGEEQARELSLSASAMNQKPRKNRRGQRVRAESMQLATYDRKELINAINEASKQTNRGSKKETSGATPVRAEPESNSGPKKGTV